MSIIYEFGFLRQGDCGSSRLHSFGNNNPICKNALAHSDTSVFREHFGGVVRSCRDIPLELKPVKKSQPDGDCQWDWNTIITCKNTRVIKSNVDGKCLFNSISKGVTILMEKGAVWAEARERGERTQATLHDVLVYMGANHEILVDYCDGYVTTFLNINEPDCTSAIYNTNKALHLGRGRLKRQTAAERKDLESARTFYENQKLPDLGRIYAESPGKLAILNEVEEFEFLRDFVLLELWKKDKEHGEDEDPTDISQVEESYIMEMIDRVFFKEICNNDMFEWMLLDIGENTRGLTGWWGDEFVMNNICELYLKTGIDIINVSDAIRPVMRLCTDPNVDKIVLLHHRMINGLSHYDFVKVNDMTTYAPRNRPCFLKNLACQQALMNADSWVNHLCCNVVVIHCGLVFYFQ